jgi:hypothetical protein
LHKLGIVAGSDRHRAISAVIRALATADVLPEPADFHAAFHPGRAFVRRVRKQNLWVWFRFDADHVVLMSLTDHPPVPEE